MGCNGLSREEGSRGRRGLGLRALAVVLLAAAAVASTGAAAAMSALPASERQFIDATVLRAMRSGHVPGAMVEVSGPSGSYERTYGTSNLASHAPMAAGLHVRISSVTETFTATAILELVQRRRLSLSDKVARWVRDVRNGRRTTVGQLLAMRSGTYGYTLLGRILQRVTGRAPQWVVAHEVIARAGLRATRFPSGAKPPRPYAHGYCAGRGGRLRDCTWVDPALAPTAGGIVSTLGDLQTWGKVLATDALLSEHEAQHLGLKRFGDWRGAAADGLGFSVATFYQPSTGAGVVVVTNRSRSSASAYAIFAAIAGRLVPSPPPPPAPLPPAPPAAPAEQSAPQLSGTARAGYLLSATTGTWTGTAPISYAFQWQRCDAGGGCQNVTGAAEPNYTLSDADLGSRLRVLVTATNTAGSSTAPSVATDVVRDTVIVAVGDIACPPGGTPGAPCVQAETAEVAAAQHPDDVLVLGDDQYDSGLITEFTGPGAYNDTWGAFNPIVHPVPGNHEYKASQTADGYFQYFGAAAGPKSSDGDYSFNLGTWHVIALNSNCKDSGGCADYDGGNGGTTSSQTAWLQADLAQNPSGCTLAFWHHPLFSDALVGGSPGVLPLWTALYRRADVVLNGHDHVYERYAQLNPSGTETRDGVREFVVGTGGEDLDPGHSMQPNPPAPEKWDLTHFGVLVMTLHPSSYDWKFIHTDGTTFDSGTTSCHGSG